MSDGVGESYRGSRAAKSFEHMWADAQVDALLLDIKAQLSTLPYSEIVERLIAIGTIVNIETYSRYKHPTPGYGYVVSLPINEAEKAEIVDLFKVTFYGSVSRAFEATSLREALTDALIFAEWLKTEAGKKAVKVYDDY